MRRRYPLKNLSILLPVAALQSFLICIEKKEEIFSTFNPVTKML